jgi:hypothetical protein
MFIIKKIINFNINWYFIPIISSIMLFLPYIFSFIGLSAIGPIACGLFSTMQGTVIVSGSLLALLQSFAMSGWIIIIQSLSICMWFIVLSFTFIKNNLRLS